MTIAEGYWLWFRNSAGATRCSVVNVGAYKTSTLVNRGGLTGAAINGP